MKLIDVRVAMEKRATEAIAGIPVDDYLTQFELDRCYEMIAYVNAGGIALFGNILVDRNIDRLQGCMKLFKLRGERYYYGDNMLAWIPGIRVELRADSEERAAEFALPAFQKKELIDESLRISE